ncbi:hypothetical protein T484DRAFT_2744500 [Baffinella frigidus]|nr:hypothetical protein T484DRAFT_2744500 [Cryptophyta sp. CCMP2293]
MYGQGEQPEQEAGQTPAGRDADPEEHGRARNSSNPSVGLFDLISFGLDSLISVRGPSGEAGEEYRRRRAEAGFPVPKLSRERDDGMPSQEEIYADLKSQKKMALAAILDLREEDVELKTEMAKVEEEIEDVNQGIAVARGEKEYSVTLEQKQVAQLRLDILERKSIADAVEAEAAKSDATISRMRGQLAELDLFSKMSDKSLQVKERNLEAKTEELAQSSERLEEVRGAFVKTYNARTQMKAQMPSAEDIANLESQVIRLQSHCLEEQNRGTELASQLDSLTRQVFVADKELAASEKRYVVNHPSSVLYAE